jgi:phosphoglycolate phosphatase-like HAD superfamily hydrolase
VDSADRAIFVGDSENDVLAARNARVRSVGIVSNIGDPNLLRLTKPDYLILNMQDLTRLFN